MFAIFKNDAQKLKIYLHEENTYFLHSTHFKALNISQMVQIFPEDKINRKLTLSNFRHPNLALTFIKAASSLRLLRIGTHSLISLISSAEGAEDGVA